MTILDQFCWSFLILLQKKNCGKGSRIRVLHWPKSINDIPRSISKWLQDTQALGEGLRPVLVQGKSWRCPVVHPQFTRKNKSS